MLTLYAGALYTQPSWYSFSSWPHNDITAIGCCQTYFSSYTLCMTFRSVLLLLQVTTSMDFVLLSGLKHTYGCNLHCICAMKQYENYSMEVNMCVYVWVLVGEPEEKRVSLHMKF